MKSIDFKKACALLQEISDSGYLRAKLTSDSTGLQERVELFLLELRNYSPKRRPRAKCPVCGKDTAARKGPGDTMLVGFHNIPDGSRLCVGSETKTAKVHYKTHENH